MEPEPGWLASTYADLSQSAINRQGGMGKSAQVRLLRCEAGHEPQTDLTMAFDKIVPMGPVCGQHGAVYEQGGRFYTADEMK